MSCNHCANQATKALTSAGVPSGQAQATWAMVFEHLDRCTGCGRFLSPTTPICNNPKCKLKGEQQGDPKPWPPEGVRFTTDRSKIESQRAKRDQCRQKVLGQVATLSSGTMATLTGLERYDDIDRAQGQFTEFVQDHPTPEQFENWQDAWAAFAETGEFATQQTEYPVLIFSDADVIHSYTRAEALEDGALVDTGGMGREAGFTCPLALTADVQALIEDIPPGRQGYDDLEGRKWDVVWMASRAAKGRIGRQVNESECIYKLILPHGRRKYATLKLTIGSGDEGEMVATISEVKRKSKRKPKSRVMHRKKPAAVTEAEKERLAKAEELGRAAFHNGTDAPAMDPAMIEMLGELGTNEGVLKAWNKGWTEENLAAPVPEN